MRVSPTVTFCVLPVVDCLLTGVINSSNNDLSILAIDCLVRIIKSGKGLWWETLSDVLAENTYQDLSDVVDLMLNDSYVHTKLEKTCILIEVPGHNIGSILLAFHLDRPLLFFRNLPPVVSVFKTVLSTSFYTVSLVTHHSKIHS